jgi:hypothetical protein
MRKLLALAIIALALVGGFVVFSTLDSHLAFATCDNGNC